MTGAVIRANLTAAAFSGVAGDALAFTGSAITNTLVGAFGELMLVTGTVGLVYPSDLERADAIRAVSSDTASHAPIVVAIAYFLVAA